MIGFNEVMLQQVTGYYICCQEIVGGLEKVHCAQLLPLLDPIFSCK